MPNFEFTKPGEVALISQDENGNIYQIGLTVEQSKLINAVVASMSAEHPLLKMGPEHDLVLKRNLCKKCQTK